ncbi:hypothetical protein [Actinoplanes sp. NPDC051411]|uniref:hypothetical protein n=1 Tax=Actinoplanes sp. NPDC051411 TaxID=3155522 RepID=UPI00341DE59C
MSSWKGRLRGPAGIGTALVAAVALLVLPAAGKQPVPAPAAMDLAWPQVKHAALAATLADGTAYEPGLFLTADTSIGTAPSKDRKSMRLLEHRPTGPDVLIRKLPQKGYPSFSAITAAGDTLVWIERVGSGPPSIWTSGLRRPAPRRLTADAGDVQSDQSTFDLVIAGGQVYWTASGAARVTEVRSVALSGGPVSVRPEPGDWKLTAWPYLVNGVTETTGTTAIRDLRTGRDQAVRGNDRATTRCSATWCEVVGGTTGGTTVELMRPDGSHRQKIGGDDIAGAISDPVVLDRFEILAQIDDNTQLTNHVQLIAYELATRRQVVLSPDAFGIAYRAGVLWWSTGTDADFVRHAVDLRTV